MITSSVLGASLGEPDRCSPTNISSITKPAIRLIGFLPPGQKQVISVGSFATTSAPATLELVHQGDLLSASQSPGEALAQAFSD